ncbi:MAG TPA: CRISPR-associated protein Cas4 [Chitinispirillaceae bacterium]|nr:CRISPR-associated protein Cas4 [Chitinispirillaceae bacterium]
MYSESDLLPISALQHIIFCERQCALIHIERQWAENRLTAEGQILHEKTDKEEVESRGNLRIARALYIHNFELGLYGKADVVEFHKGSVGVVLPNLTGLWMPFPVEYKRGKPKADRCDEIQLCAQALCLEEMLRIEIPEGALFYGTPRRRTPITFNSILREETKSASEKLRALIKNGKTPPAAFQKKCENCSLIDLCMPHIEKLKKTDNYIEIMFNEIDKDVS